MTVERRHRDLLGGGEQFRPAGVLGQPDAPHVVVQVEVGVGDPGGRADAAERLDDALAKARHEPCAPLVGGDEAIPVRHGVELLEPADRGAQAWVLLGAPHQCLERVHLPLASPVQRPVLGAQHRFVWRPVVVISDPVVFGFGCRAARGRGRPARRCGRR